MPLEKILVGDDSLDLVRKIFPTVPNTEVEFVDNPDEFVRRAKRGDYSVLITDLMYTPTGQEGFDVLGRIRDLTARKILWTGNAYDEGVREKARELGAETLDKTEIGTLVGQVVSRAKIKEEGDILVYHSDSKSPAYKALKQIFGTLESYGKIIVGHNLKEELESGKYALVIDTTTIGQNKGYHGSVAHDMKYLKLPEVPRVVGVYDITKVVVDVINISGQFFAHRRQKENEKAN